MASSCLEAYGARVQTSAVADEDSLLQVRLEIEEAETPQEQLMGCQRSLSHEECAADQLRFALVAYRKELRHHEEVLKALKKSGLEAGRAARVMPHVSAMLQELSQSRFKLLDVWETLGEGAPLLKTREAALPSAASPVVAQVPVVPGIRLAEGQHKRLVPEGAGPANATDPVALGASVPAPNASGNTSAGGRTVEPLPRRAGEHWIIMAFIALVLVLLGSMLMVLGYLKIEDDTKKAADKHVKSSLIQVLLPYWVHTTPNSCGILWLILFAGLVVFSLAVIFWVAAGSLALAHLIWPMMIRQGSTHMFQSTGLRVASLFALGVVPVIFLSQKKQLEGRWVQWMLLGFRIFVLLAVNMWNVVTSYISRAQTDALFWKDQDAFWNTLRLLYAGHIVCTGLFMIGHLSTGMLCIRWRDAMTRRLMDLYMANRSYYDLDPVGGGVGVDNPEQRIQEDSGMVTSQSVQLVLQTFSSFTSLLSFAVVLYNLRPSLTFSCMGYAVAGTAITLRITWELVKRTFVSQRCEADFRFSLTHIRNNAEAIAFYRGEEPEKSAALGHFAGAIDIAYRILNWEVGVNGFSYLYRTAAMIVPSLLVPRMYFNGTIDFGAVTQAEMAFMRTLESVSFVINERSMVTNLATSANRVGSLLTTLSRLRDEAAGVTCIAVQGPILKIKDLTAQVPSTSQAVVRSLSFTTACGGRGQTPVRLLLAGRSGVGKSSLLRVLAGLWRSGHGEVMRPPDEECMFLPQRPYMPGGSLRAQLLYPEGRYKEGSRPRDPELRVLLGRTGLGSLPERFEGGFDAVADWTRVLSLGEQQRVAAVRCFLHMPKLTVLDEATSALSTMDETRLYEHFRNLNLSYISVGHRDGLFSYHDSVLELKGNGDWQLHGIEDYRTIAASKDISM